MKSLLMFLVVLSIFASMIVVTFSGCETRNLEIVKIDCENVLFFSNVSTNTYVVFKIGNKTYMEHYKDVIVKCR